MVSKTDYTVLACLSIPFIVMAFFGSLDAMANPPTEAPALWGYFASVLVDVVLGYAAFVVHKSATGIYRRNLQVFWVLLAIDVLITIVDFVFGEPFILNRWSLIFGCTAFALLAVSAAVNAYWLFQRGRELSFVKKIGWWGLLCAFVLFLLAIFAVALNYPSDKPGFVDGTLSLLFVTIGITSIIVLIGSYAVQFFRRKKPLRKVRKKK